MVLLLKQWKSRSSPGFAGGVSKSPFAMLKMPLSRLSRGGIFVWARERPDVGAGWSSPVARQAHNLKVAGSNPAPATNTKARFRAGFFFALRRCDLGRAFAEPDVSRARTDILPNPTLTASK